MGHLCRLPHHDRRRHCRRPRARRALWLRHRTQGQHHRHQLRGTRDISARPLRLSKCCPRGRRCRRRHRQRDGEQLCQRSAWAWHPVGHRVDVLQVRQPKHDGRALLRPFRHPRLQRYGLQHMCGGLHRRPSATPPLRRRRARGPCPQQVDLERVPGLPLGPLPRALGAAELRVHPVWLCCRDRPVRLPNLRQQDRGPNCLSGADFHCPSQHIYRLRAVLLN
mmetsp:Transcript_10155/g.24240  ORF Transcript_10155/g.24240 Transcript_10155/m.24240 type:complete len:222 (+) Transcript_10155:2401-3066(+)